MDVERKHLIKAYQANKVDLELSYIRHEYRLAKMLERTNVLRQQANEKYKQPVHDTKNHIETFCLYSRSIAMAPLNSQELSLAYGNRSAFLLHVGKYQESINDIDRALQISTSDVLRIKLLCRKVECLKAMGSSECEKALHLAKSCFERMSNKDKSKVGLLNIIEKAKARKVEAEGKVDEERKVLEDIYQKVIPTVNDSVAINRQSHNEKYDQHLVAIKDFDPGEIIFAETLYVRSVNMKRPYANCFNCLKSTWSIIPCDHCGIAMFCNEECKKKGWEDFHSIECEVIPRLGILGDIELIHTHGIALRTLILGVKETGCIMKLKKELEAVDQSLTRKEFFQDRNLSHYSMKNIYMLNIDGVSEAFYQEFAPRTLKLLICLIKYSTFFGKNFKLEYFEQFIKREETMFIACLFLRLCAIKDRYANYISNFNLSCEYMEDKITCEFNKCCIVGYGLASWSNLINHNCYPNAGRLFLTEDRKIVVYALRPIKENDQICISYCENFYNELKSVRQLILKCNFRVDCKCQACMEDWPTILYLRENVVPKEPLEIKLFEEFKTVFDDLNYGETEFSKELVEKLSKAVAKATKRLKQPSEITCLLIDALDKVFTFVYKTQYKMLIECNK